MSLIGYTGNLGLNSGQSQSVYQLDTSHALRNFLATLSDEQRATFVALAKNAKNRDVPPLLRQLVP